MTIGRFLVATGLALSGITPALAQSGNQVYTSLAPCRIADTRPGAGGTGALGPGETRTFHVVGSTSNFAGQGGTAGGCGIPGFSGVTPRVSAVLFNFVAVAPAGAGNLRAWATDQAVPNASILNYAVVSGLNIANGIAVPVRQDSEGDDLSVRADASGTHVVIDVVGYFSPITQSDGPGSNIDADFLDGQDSLDFAAANHNHDAAYVNEGQPDSISTAMIQDGATLAEILDDDGAGSTLDADRLDGLDSVEFWRRTGNAGTVAGTHFLGTLDNVSLEVRTNNSRVALIQPNGVSPNVIFGNPVNVALANGTLGATISGGGFQPFPQTVTDDFGTIGGGWNNRAGNNAGDQFDARWATVGGGADNVAGARYATVPGGQLNFANGPFSFAAGFRAKANHPGAFVWGDSQNADVASTANDQFVVRAGGGLWFGTNSAVAIGAGRFIDTSTGAHLTLGGAWTNASDATLKENFEAVDGAAVLDAVARLPVRRWNYKAEGQGVHHVGPTAQDFHAAFGLGADDRSVSTIDPAGVSLVAIQELHRRLQARDAEVAALRAELAALATRLEAMAQEGASPQR